MEDAQGQRRSKRLKDKNDGNNIEEKSEDVPVPHHRNTMAPRSQQQSPSGQNLDEEEEEEKDYEGEPNRKKRRTSPPPPSSLSSSLSPPSPPLSPLYSSAPSSQV